MKRNKLGFFIVFAGIFMLLPKAEAQKGEIRYGLLVAPTLGWGGEPDNTVEAKGAAIGIRYGLVLDYALDDDGQVALATGINVHHTSSKFDSPTDEYKVSTTLVEIPAALKMSTRENGGRRFFGQFGLLFGLPLGNTVKEGFEPNADVDHVQLALRFGLGTEMTLEQFGIDMSLGLFYDNGFSNVYVIESQEFRMKHLSLGAAFYF